MAEQVAPGGDTLAVAAAMQIIGASHVETLDTKGTDGSNVHLGGPETITGYFGGIGQPNDYPLKWIDEYLGYLTDYGIRQVLNVNPGTILVAYLLHKLGRGLRVQDLRVHGQRQPVVRAVAADGRAAPRARDGSSSLIGFNLSNSVNNETIRECDRICAALGLDHAVRFEHHITETYKSIVRQPYLRRDELVELAADVPNISAKHEGGDPDVEATREHPSDILDYFLPKKRSRRRASCPLLEQLPGQARRREPHGRGAHPGRHRRARRRAAARAAGGGRGRGAPPDALARRLIAATVRPTGLRPGSQADAGEEGERERRGHHHLRRHGSRRHGRHPSRPAGHAAADRRRGASTRRAPARRSRTSTCATRRPARRRASSSTTARSSSASARATSTSIINLTTGMGGDLVVDDAAAARGRGRAATWCRPCERLEHVEALLPEMCTLDCGTMNFGDGDYVAVVTAHPAARHGGARQGARRQARARGLRHRPGLRSRTGWSTRA